MNAYGYRTNVRTKKHTALGTAVRFLRAVYEVLRERIGACEIRIAATLVNFVVALGVVGGMESGSISMYVGLPVCVALAIAALLTHFDD
ncbi:MAG: hypothetical protein IJ002_04060 [Clostridia bacterium]|nr:hypothetical protein [Clostridia bacterium]